MINPIIKVIMMIINRFLDFVIIVPVRSPIGVIESSTPTLKKSIPIISIAAPTKKVSKISGGIGAMEKQRKSTINSMGNTAFSVSLSFSLNLDFSLKCFKNKAPNRLN